MYKFTKLYPADCAYSPFILYDFNENGKRVLRQRYSIFQCNVCKKVDEYKSLESGLDESIVLSSKRDLIASVDHMYVVSDRLKCALINHMQDCFKFYCFPSDPSHSVAVATNRIIPNRDDPAFRFVGSPCINCGRNIEVISGKSIYDINDSVQIASLCFESRLGENPIWAIRNDIAEEFKKSKPLFKGLLWKPYLSRAYSR